MAKEDYLLSKCGRENPFKVPEGYFDQFTDDLMAIAKEIPFVHKVERNDGITGSEDVTMICRRVRAHGGKVGFFIFGCNEHGHHKGDFEIQDSESMPEAFEMFTRFLLKTNKA